MPTIHGKSTAFTAVPPTTRGAFTRSLNVLARAPGAGMLARVVRFALGGSLIFPAETPYGRAGTVFPRPSDADACGKTDNPVTAPATTSVATIATVFRRFATARLTHANT